MALYSSENDNIGRALHCRYHISMWLMPEFKTVITNRTAKIQHRSKELKKNLYIVVLEEIAMIDPVINILVFCS